MNIKSTSVYLKPAQAVHIGKASNKTLLEPWIQGCCRSKCIETQAVILLAYHTVGILTYYLAYQFGISYLSCSTIPQEISALSSHATMSTYASAALSEL